MVTVESLRAAMSRVRALGLGLAVHAIGDAAVRAVLDAYEAEGGAWETAPGVPPLRIEHAEIIDAADVPRFAELGVVCSVQPCHLLYDIEALQRGLPHRLDRVLPLRELIDSGLEPGEGLWFGSDVPIVRPHPGDSILAAVRRGREDGAVRIAPSQAISEAEAWRCFGERATSSAARR
jgi:predicted amidohydrolase YtcJ